MKKHLKLAVIASLTLGLAPFFPHPHIWKQLRNIWFSRPMASMDWIDLLMHGAPWVFLIVILVSMALEKRKRQLSKTKRQSREKRQLLKIKRQSLDKVNNTPHFGNQDENLASTPNLNNLPKSKNDLENIRFKTRINAGKCTSV